MSKEVIRDDAEIRSPRLWKQRGWVAEIVDDEDGGGWAVAMTRDGDEEPVLVVPWVMGRNKKDPKPLNESDFFSQLKAAQDVLRRREQQQRAALRRSIRVYLDNGDELQVVLDVIADEWEPRAELSAIDRVGNEVARVDASPGFKLSRESAKAWVKAGFPAMDSDGGAG